MYDNPLQTDTTFERDIEETLSIPPKDIPGVENKYDGLIINDQIWKYLHIEEWSCPDLA